MMGIQVSDPGALVLPGAVVPSLPPWPVRQGCSGTSLKNGIFLTILHLPAVVNAAELLPLVVVVTLVAYSAAKGGPRPVNAKQ